MFTQILFALLIPLCTGLFADLTDKQGEVSLESMAKNIIALGSLVQTLSTQVQNLTSQVEILNRKQAEVVSFKAYPSRDRVFGLGSTIVFDTVETNVGGGYNPSSGVFHVPITGIYTFTVQIETTQQGTSEYMLYNQAVGESVMTIRHEFDSKTMTVIIHAVKGNDVYVKKVYDVKNAPLRTSTWTQFSGHLLRAD